LAFLAVVEVVQQSHKPSLANDAITPARKIVTN
jgi:hypothetical protein